ncbi:MAG: hypothetical protein JKY54_02180, partial [Flavobacteriales bacterium]|nr:hypothetical protein [Flavobacteriales bacterium]
MNKKGVDPLSFNGSHHVINGKMKVLTTLIIAMITLSGFCQGFNNDVKVQWGEEIRVSKKERFTGLVGNDASGYYMLKNKVGGMMSGASGVILQKFDV